MSTAITLIQPEEIVNGGLLRGAPISMRFDAAELGPHIKLAEIRFLKPLICNEFYQYLILEKDGRVSSYNIDICPLEDAYPNDPILEKLWTEFLLPYLSYCVLFQALPYIAIKTTSNGIFTNETQFAENVGKTGFKILQDTTLSNIEILREELRKHLCKNQNIYPLFCADCHCNCDCGISGCEECEDTKVKAPNLGIILY